MSRNRKILSLTFAFMILFVGVAYADEIANEVTSITANIYATILIPNTVEYGDLLIGEESTKKTLFQIETMATGSKFNITLLNGTDNAIFYLIDPHDTQTKLDPDVMKEFDGYQGNYTLDVIPKKVGALSYMVKFQFNKSHLNFTRY